MFIRGPLSPQAFYVPPTPAVPNVVVEDDSGGDWWAGVMQCGARVALATAIVASTLSAQIGQRVANGFEEYVTSPAQMGGGGSQPFAQFTRADTRVRYIYQGDEYVPPPAAAVALEEETWTPPVPQQQRGAVRGPFTDDEEIVAQPIVFSLEEDTWTLRLPERQSVVPRLFSDDDDLPVLPPPSLSIDEEESWSAPRAQPPVTQVRVLWADEELPAQAIASDEESWRLPRPQQVVQSVPRPIWVDDDLPIAPLLALTEDDWTTPRPQGVSNVPRVFSADDDLPVTVAAPSVAEDDYSPSILRSPKEQDVWIPAPWAFGGEDALPSQAPEEYWFRSLTSPQYAPPPRVATDTEELVSQAAGTPVPATGGSGYLRVQWTPPKVRYQFSGEEFPPLALQAFSGTVHTFPRLAGTVAIYTELEDEEVRTFARLTGTTSVFAQLDGIALLSARLRGTVHIYPSDT